MPRRLNDSAVISRAIEFINRNREQIVVDLAIMLAWIVGSTALFHWLSIYQWLHYLVLFAGVAIYTRLTPAWERPSRKA